MTSKVIILSAFLSPFRSGAEACAEEVALRLADRYDITIVTARMRRDLPRRDILHGKVAVRRVGLGFGFDKWFFPFLAPITCRKIAASVPSGQPIILHAVLETFAGLALHFCRWTVPGAKRLLTLQTTNRRFLKGPIVRSADAVTAISSALRDVSQSLGRKDVTLGPEALSSSLSLRAEGRAEWQGAAWLTVIPNGIPLGRIEAACAEVQRVPGRILFVGRLERMKGVDTLLRAFAELALSYPSPTLRIVGDGSEKARLEGLAAELGVASRVAFAGFIPVDRVAHEFAAAEIFCGLSRSEALGNVFLEAQAAGCAVVATRVGGIPEIVEDGATGILVPPDDVPAARGALGRLLKDAGFRGLLAERARARARPYDWGVIAGRYAEVYERLAQTPPPAGAPRASPHQSTLPQAPSP